jgi:molybdenum cofactor cytidylyltransferase
MRFGEIALAEAEGAILAHSTKAGSRTLKKGRRLDAADIAALRDAGIARVVAARLEPGDVPEDEAATRLARAAAGQNVSVAEAFTGRVNLFAETRGLLQVDRKKLDALNLVDESVTIATLEPWAVVEPRQMVATVKIIPFAAPGAVVDKCAALAAGLVEVRPFRPMRTAVIQTELPTVKPSVLEKTGEITRQRLAALDASVVAEARSPHAEVPLAEKISEAVRGSDLVLVVGASAIVDRRDVIPAAVERAGGKVEHFGMPVDPGNLLLLGRIGEVPVLGLPGCARSPKLNGFDWVLQRLAAGVPVTRQDVMQMGAGGLLAEIPSRPQPRGGDAKPEKPRAPRIGALVLAAGQSRRMGGPNKLLVPIDGVPMVRRTAEAVLASGAAPVVAVLGHQRDAIAAALAGLDLRLIDNPDFADGLSTSLKRGLAALPDNLDGALVCLGDMPMVRPEEIRKLIAGFNPLEGRAILVPTRRGKRGNPVLFARRFFAEMQEIAGDAGAKHLLGAYPEIVAEVPMGSEGVLLDFDTPESLETFARTGRDTPPQ